MVIDVVTYAIAMAKEDMRKGKVAPTGKKTMMQAVVDEAPGAGEIFQHNVHAMAKAADEWNKVSHQGKYAHYEHQQSGNSGYTVSDGGRKIAVIGHGKGRTTTLAKLIGEMTEVPEVVVDAGLGYTMHAGDPKEIADRIMEVISDGS